MNAVSGFGSSSSHLQTDNSFYGQPTCYYPSYLHGPEVIDQDNDRERDYWGPPSPGSVSPEDCRFFGESTQTSRYLNLDSVGGHYFQEATDNKGNPLGQPQYTNEGLFVGGYSPQGPGGDPGLQGDYCTAPAGAYHELSSNELPVVRGVKRRNTANKKERRRTQSINNAFADLRECIPNVPADTKLSKIKTLRLATSYIGYLMGVLENEDCGDGFKADLSNHTGRRPGPDCHRRSSIPQSEGRKAKGRTGWPQHVWALELKQETL